MYAVVSSGGKQYKVEEGETLRVEKIAGKVGSPVTFDRVLMISDGTDVNIGQPVLADAIVEGHIVEQGKAKKIIVFKYKRRKRYRRKQGHRQQYTAIKIDSIQAKGLTAGKKAEAKVAKDTEPAAKQKETEKPETKAAPSVKEAPKAAAQKEAPRKGAAKKPAAPMAVAPKTAAKKTAPQKPAAKKTTAPQKSGDKTQ
jgi:large subunit ribosomal protein L21